ncbi:hypothetical protein [Amycolatopsis saalfeldensis]|nr:hypothetical protein [Amycolatopsis saalfeldensis]
MGKGNRNRRDRDDRPKPQPQQVAGMAADEPMPKRDAPGEQGRWAQRVLDQTLHATLFLLNYVAFVDQGGFDVPVTEARREDETQQDYEKRRDVTRMLKETEAAAGSWAELCVDELRNIKPSDAGEVAKIILGEGIEWCRQSSFDPRPSDMVAGARSLLQHLCPAEHKLDAVASMMTILDAVTKGRRLPIDEIAPLNPIGTIHAAAALTGHLFAQAECVPDRAATQRELIDKGKQCADSLSGH